MAWYDVFAKFYDRSVEKLYREARAAAVEALAVDPGAGLRVLDARPAPARASRGSPAPSAPRGA